MSFTKEDFAKLNNENKIKKIVFAIKNSILNNEKENLDNLLQWFKEYNNEDFIKYKNNLEQLLEIFLEKLKKINPFSESHPFDNLKENKKYKVKIILDNIRSPFNVGSIIRTSECFGIEEIILCGITPTPELNNKVKKTMMNSPIKYSYTIDTTKAIKELKNNNYKIIALEKSKNSISISKFKPALPLVLITGNEEFGLSKEILELADKSIHIDLYGYKNSLNVSVATGIALHYIINKIKN